MAIHKQGDRPRFLSSRLPFILIVRGSFDVGDGIPSLDWPLMQRCRRRHTRKDRCHAKRCDRLRPRRDLRPTLLPPSRDDNPPHPPIPSIMAPLLYSRNIGEMEKPAYWLPGRERRKRKRKREACRRCFRESSYLGLLSVGSLFPRTVYNRQPHCDASTLLLNTCL